MELIGYSATEFLLANRERPGCYFAVALDILPVVFVGEQAAR
jgi:hypothetical protein